MIDWITVNGQATFGVVWPLVYDVIKDPEDSWTQAAATPSERPLRVAISRSVPFGVTTKVDAEQLSALDNAGEILRGLGHEVVERGAPWGRALPHFLARYFRGIADDAEHMAHPEKLSDWTKAYARWGRLMPAWLVRRSLRKAIEDRERFARFLQEFDVIVTPQFTSRPIKVGAWDGKGAFAAYIGFSGWVPFNAAFNHTGQPAMVVPVGFAPDGFPLVVQIVGAPDGDAALLSLAAQMQGARDWTAERPPNYA